MLIGGSITLLWQVQQGKQTHAAMADMGNVIGSPTLPAATVDSIFARLGSPMVGTGNVVEQAARQANIDDAFALGVWWTETNDGAAGVGSADRNPGSIRGSYGYPAAFDGYTIYPSYTIAIVDWFNVLKTRYISRGLTSAYTICYPYVGTSSSLLWANKVVNLMIEYRAEAPPPPTPTPTLPPQLVRQARNITTIDSSHTPMPAFEQGQQTGETRSKSVYLQNRQFPQATGAFLPTTTELLVVLFGLLLALAIALAGSSIGNRQLRPGIEPMQQSWQPQVQSIAAIQEPVAQLAFADGETQLPFPPLFANQYSPVREIAQLDETPFEWQLIETEASTQSSWVSRYDEQYTQAGRRRTAALPHRVVLHPARFYAEASSQAEPHADTLHRPIPLPANAPQPVPIRHGLLARYGNEQNGNG